jgi:multicomponent Na+:H+ antiporter subunit F
VLHTVTTIALAGLFGAAVLCMIRLVRPGSVADRIVALDALLLVTVSAVAVLSVRTGSSIYLPVLVVAAVVAFVGTLTAARYMESRGAQ